MPSDQADSLSRTGRPVVWAAGLVLLGLLAALLWYVVRDDTEVITPVDSGDDAAATPHSRAEAAAALLRDLESALNDGTRREAVSLSAPGEREARRALRVIYGNVRAVGVEEISLRYIAGDSGRTSDQDRRTFGSDAWVAYVALGWQLEGEGGSGSMEIALTLVDTDQGVSFGSASGDYGTPAPLWMLEELAVAESRQSLVAVADQSNLKKYASLAGRAVRDVRAVLPSWRGELHVQVPSSPEQLHRVLDAEAGTYDAIAAVTATVDGSMSSSAPVHIIVNPDVFGGLRADGAQIVMSHEATHVAMDAAVSTTPLWLLEGFADYVALARTGLPVEVTASQILAQVRRSGPPQRLPDAEEFDPTNKLLGSSYEAAWLANRLLAEGYGERRLVAFYRAVDSGTPVAEAFEGLGTTEQRFTRRWRNYLLDLAG